MDYIKSINDLKFCEAGDCGNCYSTCQSQYKDSSGMTTHECENPLRFETTSQMSSKSENSSATKKQN